MYIYIQYIDIYICIHLYTYVYMHTYVCICTLYAYKVGHMIEQPFGARVNFPLYTYICIDMHIICI